MEDCIVEIGLVLSRLISKGLRYTSLWNVQSHANSEINYSDNQTTESSLLSNIHHQYLETFL